MFTFKEIQGGIQICDLSFTTTIIYSDGNLKYTIIIDASNPFPHIEVFDTSAADDF